MSNRRTKPILAAIPAALIAMFPVTAFAHPGHDAGGDAFAAGLLHPLSGADHLSAMLLAGCWSAFLGRRHLLRLPAVLLAAMTAGFLAGPNLGSTLAETLIAFSVVALAAAVVLRLRPPMTLAVPAMALFGFGHGLAHGIESSGTRLAFMSGMLAASATLLALGAVAGLMLSRRFQALPARN